METFESQRSRPKHAASTSAHRSEFLVADGVVVACKAGQQHRHLAHAREAAARLLLAPGVITALTANGFVRTNWDSVSRGRRLPTLKTAGRELPSGVRMKGESMKGCFKVHISRRGGRIIIPSALQTPQETPTWRQWPSARTLSASHRPGLTSVAAMPALQPSCCARRLNRSPQRPCCPCSRRGRKRVGEEALV